MRLKNTPNNWGNSVGSFSRDPTRTRNTTDKIFVASIDRNNNVSTWVQVNTSEVAKTNNDKKSSSGNKQ